MLSSKIAWTGLSTLLLILIAFAGVVWAGDHTVSVGVPEATRLIIMWVWIVFCFVMWIARMVQIWFEGNL